MEKNTNLSCCSITAMLKLFLTTYKTENGQVTTWFYFYNEPCTVTIGKGLYFSWCFLEQSKMEGAGVAGYGIQQQTEDLAVIQARLHSMVNRSTLGNVHLWPLEVNYTPKKFGYTFLLRIFVLFLPLWFWYPFKHIGIKHLLCCPRSQIIPSSKSTTQDCTNYVLNFITLFLKCYHFKSRVQLNTKVQNSVKRT